MRTDPRATDRRFRPAQRIRTRPAYQSVYDRGTKVHGRLMTVFMLPRSDRATRLGITATRRIGGAVQRNRAKRLIREVFRQHPHPPGFVIVVIPRAGLPGAGIHAVETDYATCIERGLSRTKPAR
jgi:ribonuclease P protein component